MKQMLAPAHTPTRRPSFSHSPSAMSSTLVIPLLLPEIISTLAPFLDRQDLIRCLRVCSLWLCFLEPELYREFNLPRKVLFPNRTTRRRRRAAFRIEQERLAAANLSTVSLSSVSPAVPSENLPFNRSPQTEQDEEYRHRRITAATLRRNSIHIRNLCCTSLSMLEYLAPLCTRLQKVSLSRSLNLKASFLLSMNATSLRTIHLSVDNLDQGMGLHSDQVKEHQASLWTFFKVMAEQLFGLEELRLEQLRLCGWMPVGPFALTVFARIRILDLRPLSLASGWPWQSYSASDEDTEGHLRMKLMPNMRSLSVIMNAEPVTGFVLSECPNLTSFTWSSFGINNVHVKAQVEEMLELVKKIETLERIELRHSPTISDDQWCQVIEALPRLRALDATSTGFGLLACHTVAQREIERARDRTTDGKPGYGTRHTQEFEELNLQHCNDVTSRGMLLLLWSCHHLKILRGTTLEERAMDKDFVRKLTNGTINNSGDWLWPSSKTLQHLELSIVPDRVPSDRSEVPLIKPWSTDTLPAISGHMDETSKSREKTTLSSRVSPDEISNPEMEPTLLRHQFMSLSSLQFLKTNYWTLAQVYRASADNSKHDSTRERPNPQLRSIEIESWIGTPRREFVSPDPLIKEWLPKAVPSLRRITCLKLSVWEWEPSAFHDELPFNSRPLNV